MAQIDKIIYIPLIFWFILLLAIIYFIVFSMFLGTFLSISKVRVLFYLEAGNQAKANSDSLKGLAVLMPVGLVKSLASLAKVGN